MFKGPARVFDREKDAFDAVMEGRIKKGNIPRIIIATAAAAAATTTATTT